MIRKGRALQEWWVSSGPQRGSSNIGKHGTLSNLGFILISYLGKLC